MAWTYAKFQIFLCSKPCVLFLPVGKPFIMKYIIFELIHSNVWTGDKWSSARFARRTVIISRWWDQAVSSPTIEASHESLMADWREDIAKFMKYYFPTGGSTIHRSVFLEIFIELTMHILNALLFFKLCFSFIKYIYDFGIDRWLCKWFRVIFICFGWNFNIFTDKIIKIMIKLFSGNSLIWKSRLRW